MTERLIEKLDRLGEEAGIPEMTPAIRRFAMLVRQDVVAQRTWVGLTDEEVMEIAFNFDVPSLVVRTAEAKLKEKNT